MAAVTATITRVNAERRKVRQVPYVVTSQRSETRALVEQIEAILESEGHRSVSRPENVVVELLAVALRRIRQTEDYLDSNGLLAPDGAVRSAAEYLVQLLREARGYCELLGMTPRACSVSSWNLAAATHALPLTSSHSPEAQETGRPANVRGDGPAEGAS